MIYIQKNEQNMPHHFDASCAMYGAIEQGKKYKLTSYEDIDSGKYDNLIIDNVFVGSVEFMRNVFSRVGLYDVRFPINNEDKTTLITLGEALDISKIKKIFIKPYIIKQFSGLVLDGFRYSCLNDIPLDTMVFVYDIWEDSVISEHRIYVHNGNIKGIHEIINNDYTVTFNDRVIDFIYRIIEKNMKMYPNNLTYSFDIALFKNMCKVIEYNDFWSLGNYGLDNNTYLFLLSERYKEIMKNI